MKSRQESRTLREVHGGPFQGEAGKGGLDGLGQDLLTGGGEGRDLQGVHLWTGRETEESEQRKKDGIAASKTVLLQDPE